MEFFEIISCGGIALAIGAIGGVILSNINPIVGLIGGIIVAAVMFAVVTVVLNRCESSDCDGYDRY